LAVFADSALQSVLRSLFMFRGVFRAKYQLLASISLAVLKKQIYGDHTNPFNLGSTSFRFLADATHMFLPFTAKFLTEENDCGGTISHAGPETAAALIATSWPTAGKRQV
jgi:hypothetical protein